MKRVLIISCVVIMSGSMLASCSQVTGTWTTNFSDIDSIADKFTDDPIDNTDDPIDNVEVRDVFYRIQHDFHAFLPNLMRSFEYVGIAELPNSYYVFFANSNLQIEGTDNGMSVISDGQLLSFELRDDSNFNLQYYNDGIDIAVIGGGNLLWSKVLTTDNFMERVPLSD